MSRAPVCERYYGSFLLLWGLLLQYDHYKRFSGGVFYGALEDVAPGWVWGIFMIALGVARLVAYLYGSKRLRLGLSSTTVVLFWVIASVAFWQKLFGATFPLCAFLGVWSFWCHRSLARDLEIGL